MVINMASAKSRAIKQLGSEDDYIGLKALNKERDIAKNVYGTTTTSLKNTYDNLLSTLANRRDTNVKDFNKGRGTVRENAFFASRNDLANLANRGLSGGLAQLSKLGNRMETGRQYSDLANTFYNTANEIDAQETQGTQTYNTDLSMAKNTLDATLANIAGREADARNRYKTALANLIEQIKTRDAMNYANSLQANALKDAKFNEAQSALAGTYGSLKYADDIIKAAQDVVNSGKAQFINNKGERVTVNNVSQAMDWLQRYGVYRNANVTTKGNKTGTKSKAKVITGLTSYSTLPDYLTKSIVGKF